MYGKSRLTKLVKQRDDHWTKINNKIMQELAKFVFPAIKLFMIKIRGEEAAARVRFTSADINMDDIKHPNGMLMVWGNSIFHGGEEVEDDDGTMVTLTETQARFLSTPLQISIPIEYVENGDLQELLDFLYKVFKEQMKHIEKTRALYERQLAEQKQNTPGDLQTEYLYNILNELDQPEEVPELDLDLSDFTEEEQLMIRLSHKRNGNTIQ